MNWKNRLTNYNFWISIVSAVLLILQAFHISFDIAYINEIVTAVLGLLVVIGIINDPTKNAIVKSNEFNKTTKDSSELEQQDVQELENSNNKMNIINNETQNFQQFPIEAEDTADINNNESDFQTIINLISEEVSKAMEKFKNNESKDEHAELNHSINEDDKVENSTATPVNYNIVN